MALDDIIFGLGFLVLGSIFVWAVFMFAFGVITVRRLRKHPETSGCLGFPLLPGWETMSVAAALSLPGFILRGRESGLTSMFRADSATMYRHTSLLDRLLGRICYWAHIIAFISIMTVVALQRWL